MQRAYPSAPERSALALILALSASQLAGWGTLYYPFSVLVTPMMGDLGWSRAELGGALGIMLAVSGFLSIPAGVWVDRRGGRSLIALGATAGALLLLAWAGVQSLVTFYIIAALVGVVVGCTAQDFVGSIVIANIENYRRAIILIAIVAGLSSGFVPLISFLTSEYGWRGCLVWLAALEFLLGALPIAFALRGARTMVEVDGARGNTTQSALKYAVRQPGFWLLSISFGGQIFVFTAVLFQMVSILQDVGLPTVMIASAWGMVGPSQMMGRVLLLLLGNRVTAVAQGRLLVALMVLANVFLLPILQWPLMGLVLFMVCFGMAHGGLLTVRLAVLAEVIGTRSIGAVSGIMSAVMIFPRAVAPFTLAVAWQTTQNVFVVIGIVSGVSLVSALIFCVACKSAAAT